MVQTITGPLPFLPILKCNLCDPDLDILCIRSISKVALVNAGLIWIDVCPFDVHVHSKGFCYSAFCIFDAHFSCLLLKSVE